MRMIKNKIWIVNVICFICVFCAIFVQVSYLFRPVSQNRKNIVGYYNEPENSLDVVCIGGSSTYVFWAPYIAWKEQGFTSYNLATDAMSPALIKNLLVEAQKSQNPKLYLIDIRAFDVREFDDKKYREAYIRNVTDSVKYSVNRAKMIDYVFQYEKSEFTNYVANYLDLVYYHDNWQKINKNSFEYISNNKSEINKGFSFVTFKYHTKLEEKDWSVVTEEKELSEETNEIFMDLIEYCKEMNLNVLFTVNPFYQETSETKMRYNYMQRIIEENGFEFINTNDCYDEMGIDFSRDFYDKNHTNLYGAEKYTKFLAKYVVELLGVEFKHKKIIEDKWNNGYLEWEERANNHKEILKKEIEKSMVD